jgi:hypothetical protein
VVRSHFGLFGFSRGVEKPGFWEWCADCGFFMGEKPGFYGELCDRICRENCDISVESEWCDCVSGLFGFSRVGKKESAIVFFNYYLNHLLSQLCDRFHLVIVRLIFLEREFLINQLFLKGF